MAANIVVPDLGESVVEATVARWLKNEGDTVSVGDAVVVLETDKVDLEVGAETSGVLSKIVAQAGADVAVGAVLGTIEAANGQPAAQPAAPAAQPAPTPPAPQPAAESAEPSNGKAATPVARRMAQDQQIDIAQVPASGPGGRVTKSDVQKFIVDAPTPVAAQVAAPPAVVTPAPVAQNAPRSVAPSAVISAPDPRGEERIKMSRRRRTIAARLVEAQQTAAMLTTFNEIDMSAVMAQRDRRKEAFKQKYGVNLGFSSYFVKAVIGALKAFPPLNAEIQGDEMILKHYYDIGVAIGAEEGLVVPVLRDADRLSFAQIEQQIKDYAKQAADGTLSLEALRGGTFTITNGGVFGSMLSTPILNPPQVGILGMHNIVKRPVVVNDEIVVRPIMYVALTYDHRIVDGREAVQFLVRVKQLIEDPESLLIEG